jgi:hypothetical protein
MELPDIGCMVDRVVSLTTGHQRSDGRAYKQGYMKIRSQKLKDQREEVVVGVLNNTRIYINGYLQDTTDIEMKRIITEAGGQVVFVRDMSNGIPDSLTRNYRQTASNCTHIVTSQPLSGVKMQELLSSRNKYVVRPEWVRDCLAAGRRLREGKYQQVRRGP